MDDQPQKIDMHLLQLVFSLQAGAMQQLGKVASPINGKIERDLEMARHTIDIVEMLDNKMKGNLTEEEEKFIGHVLYELRLNYVDESKKSDTASDESSAPTETSDQADDSSPEKPADSGGES